MNPIQKAIDNIKFKIPPQILQTVFINRFYHDRLQSVNIDENILTRVIRPRVLVDCNIVGGTQMLIDLAGLELITVDRFTQVVRIPKDRTQGRSIMSVLAVNYNHANASMLSGNSPSCGVNIITQQATALLNSVVPPKVVGTANCRLIGENVIEIRDTNRIAGYGSVRCVIANDENMSHLQPRSYFDFARLVEYAVKAYIYNEYTIEMDMGELSGGQQLGKFKDIIEGYSDANELYDTFLKEKFAKIQMMNDRESITRHIRSLVGGNK